MDRILIILKKKKENGPRASSVPALGLNSMIFQHVYWYMQQISGERLQDHWSSCLKICDVMHIMTTSAVLAQGSSSFMISLVLEITTMTWCTCPTKIVAFGNTVPGSGWCSAVLVLEQKLFYKRSFSGLSILSERKHLKNVP